MLLCVLFWYGSVSHVKLLVTSATLGNLFENKTLSASLSHKTCLRTIIKLVLVFQSAKLGPTDPTRTYRFTTYRH